MTAFTRTLRDSVPLLLNSAVNERAFPGAYVVIGNARGVLYELGVGRLDWSESPQPDRHTLWDLASLTKVLATTMLAAQLAERGELDLDSPVQRYLPLWSGPGKELVSVRHLLTHTSGLPAFRPYDQQTRNPDSLAMLLFLTELERPAGNRTVYSDIGAFVLGRVVETLGGARLDALAAERLFGPLGLRETMFRPPPDLLSRIAPTEIDTLRGGLVRGAVHDERAYYLGGVAAHAGLFSTGADLSRFAMMLLQGGRLDSVRVLDDRTIDLFTRYVDSTLSNRALGWQKPERDGMRDRFPSSSWAGSYMSSRAFGHTGFTGTSIAIDPELDLFIILLSNRVNPTRDNPGIAGVRRRLADVVVTARRQQLGLTLNDGLR